MSENVTVTLPKSEYDRLLEFEKAVYGSEKYRIVKRFGYLYDGAYYYLLQKEQIEGELISEIERLKKELAEEKAKNSKKWYNKIFN